MPRADASTRIERLERIAVQLKQEGFCTIRDLAQTFGVSERTIARDLRLMRQQGLPIDADRGRGGGVRLDRNWGVGRLNLSYAEAVDMLISIAVAEQMNSAMFLDHLGAVRRQLVASFSPDKRARVTGLKDRILIGATASTTVQGHMQRPDRRAVRALRQAFVDRAALDIRYRAEGGAVTARRIEPHFLLLNYPVWYVLAFDRMRSAPRTFRCDRVLTAVQTEDSFRLAPKEEFASALSGHEVLL